MALRSIAALARERARRIESRVVSEHRLRADICHAARVLYERGHNAPADGNVSARLGRRYLLCTPTGVHKGELSSDAIVKLRLADGLSIDEKRPSSEIKMHLGIYRARADVGAIVHAHSPHAVGLTVSGQSMAEPVVPEAILGLGGIPTVPYASPTTADVAAAVLPYALRFNAFILERHGTVTLGELHSAFPLGSSIVFVKIRGDALERALTGLQASEISVSGLRLFVRDGALDRAETETGPLRQEHIYRLAVPDSLVTGRENPLLSSAMEFANSRRSLRDVVGWCFARQKSFSRPAGGRIMQSGDK